MAYGMAPEGGSTGSQHTTRATESPLGDVLRLQRGIGAARWGFFLRAETMHGFYSYLEDNPGRGDAAYHRMSHGESFLELLERRFDAPGFYCLDEPEAALSFSSVLGLVSVLHGVVAVRRPGALRHPLPRARRDARRDAPGGRRVGTAAYDVGRARAGAALAGLPRGARTLPAPRARGLKRSRLAEQRHEHRVGAVAVRPELHGAGPWARHSSGPRAAGWSRPRARRPGASAAPSVTTPSVSASTGEQVA